MLPKELRVSVVLAFAVIIAVSAFAYGQDPLPDEDVRLMTIPISIFTEQELKKGELEEVVQAGRLSVEEAKDDQEVLSIRSVSNQPLALAVLIQDDLSSDVNLNLDDIRRFIRQLPEDSRVMVAYLRGGSLQVRQSFT
ncbi:MAG: hypothetical protein OEQ28_03020, partial [Acidobacteriota bacterium]|nr:hypothetical protein [Acidobacteriota bacterium]